MGSMSSKWKLSLMRTFSYIKTTRLPGNYQHLPEWLRTPIPRGEKYTKLIEQLQGLKLNTVCQEAKCPNIGECWNGEHATATIMLMGKECTRACKFCSVKTSRQPAALDPNEPENVANAISKWDVNYVVLTSVDRDDLEDFGASHFAKTISLIKVKKPEILVECLCGDFNGKAELITIVVDGGLDVFAHNIETVERLTPHVRDRRASYSQSLDILRYCKERHPDIYTKSSIMVGCGESKQEIFQAMADLRRCHVDFLTIGQYMRPTKGHLKVDSYVHPDTFKEYEQKAYEIGFIFAACGPLIRSSYKAAEFFVTSEKKTHRYS